jgi:thiamine biosynthesis lipoprotein
MRDPDARLKRARYLFGTVCSIELAGPDAVVLAEAMEAAFAELERIQRRMSPFDPASELSRLNASAGRGPCVVSQELCEVIEVVLRMAERTQGRYDPTMWPILELWRACERAQRFPAPQELDEAAACVNWRHVHVDRSRQTVALALPTTRLDLSSVIKGYALDCALRVIRELPIAVALLDAGGELLAWRTDRADVEIGLADPRNRSETLGVIRLANRAVATSSQGEVRLLIDGQPIGHLFDTSTGLPIHAPVESVSIVAPTACVADALSTAVFVMGIEEGLELLRGVPDASGLIVHRQAQRREWIMSDGFPLVESLDAVEAD